MAKTSAKKRSKHSRKRRMLSIFLALVSLVVIYIIGSLVYILREGTPVPAPVIPRHSLVGQSGTALSFVVLGDSTSIGQGAAYEDSYAYQSAEHLAQNHRVTLDNFGVSGARVADVKTKQLPEAQRLKPDVVLLAIGANDVTHFTSSKDFTASLQVIITGLRKNNPSLPIVVTGVPAMGSVPRFPPGFNTLAAHRTKHFNDIYTKLSTSQHLSFAPIATKTGKAFAKDRTLFAPDDFHPNARGYALWTPLVNAALDQALATPEQAAQ